MKCYEENFDDVIDVFLSDYLYDIDICASSFASTAYISFLSGIGIGADAIVDSHRDIIPDIGIGIGGQFKLVRDYYVSSMTGLNIGSKIVLKKFEPPRIKTGISLGSSTILKIDHTISFSTGLLVGADASIYKGEKFISSAMGLGIGGDFRISSCRDTKLSDINPLMLSAINDKTLQELYRTCREDEKTLYVDNKSSEVKLKLNKVAITDAKFFVKAGDVLTLSYRDLADQVFSLSIDDLLVEGTYWEYDYPISTSIEVSSSIYSIGDDIFYGIGIMTLP